MNSDICIPVIINRSVCDKFNLITKLVCISHVFFSDFCNTFSINIFKLYSLFKSKSCKRCDFISSIKTFYITGRIRFCIA